MKDPDAIIAIVIAALQRHLDQPTLVKIANDLLDISRSPGLLPAGFPQSRSVRAIRAIAFKLAKRPDPQEGIPL